MGHSASGSKRVWLAAAGLAVVLGLLLAPDWVKRPVGVVGRPMAAAFSVIQDTFASGVAAVRERWSSYLALAGLREAHHLLQGELERMTSERDRLLEVAEENTRLSALLDLRPPALPPVRGARVVGRDPSRWYQSITIDRGGRHGSVADQGVALPSGIVGTVVKVFPSFSVVLLITDRQSAVPVLVQRTREQGIIEGTVGGRVRLKYLPPSSEIGTGDIILTSGLTEAFPKGLMVGTVTRVEHPEGALYPEVELAPAADLSRLEEVLILDPVPDA
ncbi:MAG: rod shape-determining protein MreC [Nitrospiria bacterium]